MKNTFFTSDIHFGHKNIIRFCPFTRPYESIEDMTERIIEHWNYTVSHNDTVYILGDVSFFNPTISADIMDCLNGTKILVKGNHDLKNLKNNLFYRCFNEVHDYLEVKIRDHYFMMFHYPIWEWNKMHHGAIHLHGHVHGKPMGIPGKILDVGWDAHGRILSYDDVVEMVKDKEVRKHGDGND